MARAMVVPWSPSPHTESSRDKISLWLRTSFAASANILPNSALEDSPIIGKSSYADKKRRICGLIPQPDKLGIHSRNHHLETSLLLGGDKLADRAASQFDLLPLQHLRHPPED